MAAWAIQTQIGPYVLLAHIGAGGMGEVWKARDTRLDRIVAIKRMKGRHSTRFQQEARAIAALNHPNICQIYDVGPDYLVMEYIDGKPLSGPVADEEAVRLALQVAGALEEAHGKKILHRDLKPGNILVTVKGAAKVLDFGLAKFMADSDATNTMDGTVLGTAAYMSPEQAQGMAVDERSDIFSFGAVLYEMLSGRRAFAGGSMAQVLIAVVRDNPAPLQSGRAADVVKRCLAKEAAQRFQSAVEVTAALEKIATKPVVEQQPSIAVLPFANMSGDKEQEYFSDGLAEEIINALAHLPGLKVTARTSAFSFKGKDVKIVQIANELGVEHVLEGSVRKAGNRIRITAQLIKADDGFHLWSERYDRELNDIFAVQDEISAAIAAVLETRLAVRPEGRKRYTPKVAAYEAYLKARHYQWKVTPEALLRSRELYQQAVALDPQFALPYAGLAEHYFIYSSFMDARDLGRESARRALDLDPALPEAHAWLGIFAAIFDYDWKAADRRFQLALSQQPVTPLLRHWYGYFYLRLVGRALEAAAEHRRALEEDPLNLIIRVGLAVSLRAAGKDDEAAEEARKILELDPNFTAAYTLQACDVTKMALPDALAYAEKGFSLVSGNPLASGLLAGLLVRNGDRARAEDLLRVFGDAQAYGAPCGFAIFHLLCSEIEQAAEWVEKALEQRQHQMVAMLLLTPPYGPMLRSSSRWPRLARMMNLPEAV